MGCCYICFESTGTEVCTCELRHAHPWCIVRTIWSSGAGPRHHACPGCRRGYRSWQVISFVALRRAAGWLVRLWQTLAMCWHILAQAPPPGVHGQHLHLLDSSEERTLDEWVTLEVQRM